MFIVDLHSKTPVYEQLKRQILEFISIGVLSSNDQLPSVRALARDLGVNPNTVSKAYSELESQGFIYTLKGKGCFVGDSNTESLIEDAQLNDFKKVVDVMKRHQINANKLISIIKELYEEDNL